MAKRSARSTGYFDKLAEGGTVEQPLTAEVRRFLGGTDPVPAIREIFQKYEASTRERGMPMERLAAELTYLMRSGAS